MPRQVFGPRVPIVAVPPPDGLTPQQQPGTRVLARAQEAIEALLLGGAVLVAHGPAQPVVRPTASVVAATEERQPEPGQTAVGKPPTDHRPTGRITVARGGDALPAEGRFTVGTHGLPISQQPARPLVARPECVRPHPGQTIVGKPPPPDETAQQAPGACRVAAAEEPPPFPGSCFARQRPLVPSDRLPTRALVARAEEPPPFAGAAAAWRVALGHPPPGRFVFTIARAEEPPPAAGIALKAGPAVEALTPQQLPGRVLVAWVEGPRPEWIAPGRALFFPRHACMGGGAIPPSLDGATPGGRFVRADAWNRAITRTPRMAHALTYVTRTKTPDEILSVVFDFTNFPELADEDAAGNELTPPTISSAVVSGPGGAALTGLTAGTPAVLAAAAVIDSQGNTVATGKGVQVALSGGGAGDDVIVQCAATLSNGSKLVIQGKIAVRNAE